MQAIVLSSVRYGESSVIVNVLARDEGRTAFIVSARKGARKPSVAALLLPLSIVDVVIAPHSKGKIPRATEVHLAVPFVSIPFDPVKRSIAFFVCELLSRSVPDGVPDADLFHFVFSSLVAFDGPLPAPFNFHIFFTIQLANYLGFGPDVDRADGQVLDLETGLWSSLMPVHHNVVVGRIASLWHSFATADILALDSIALSLAERQELLAALIRLFKIHHPSFGDMKSQDVLAQVR